jgi:hypothetical protein
MGSVVRPELSERATLTELYREHASERDRMPGPDVPRFVGYVRRIGRRATEVRDVAWRAQLRLCGKRNRMLERGKPLNKITTAVARELAGFTWSLGHAERLLA